MKYLIRLLSCFCAFAVQAATDRPNILFIAVDDLRPEMGCYGASQMLTPNMDRLAESGVLFERAYCNVAVCGASRASLMSGTRPTATRFLNHMSRQDKDAPDVPSLPEYLRQHGYYTISNGKIYHFSEDTPESWSEPAWRCGISHSTYVVQANNDLAAEHGRGPAFECADVPDEAYPDGLTAAKAVSDLQRLARKEEPFFLAVGFLRPHLPFNAPKQYWDLYDPATITQPANHFFPVNAPEEARYNWGELRSYYGIPKDGVIEDPALRAKLRHGYYAATSFADAQVGKLLGTLDELGLADNTIVVLWGDHGWQLGEHTFWCKHTNFEVAVHVPLIIRDGRRPSGGRANGLVEYVDLYPTLCELAGVEQPSHLQGTSLVPLLDDSSAPGKTAVFSRFGNGESVRTDRYRYTAFIKDGAVVSDMLYDLLADPMENINIVDLPAMAETAGALRSQLLDHIAGRK